MSQNLQQENVIKCLQDALDSIDGKYQGDTDNYAKYMKKVEIFTRFITELSNKGLSPNIQPHLEETKVKVEQDLSTVRDYLNKRKRIDQQAISSLSRGMALDLSLQFANKHSI